MLLPALTTGWIYIFIVSIRELSSGAHRIDRLDRDHRGAGRNQQPGELARSGAEIGDYADGPISSSRSRRSTASLGYVGLPAS